MTLVLVAEADDRSYISSASEKYSSATPPHFCTKALTSAAKRIEMSISGNRTQNDIPLHHIQTREERDVARELGKFFRVAVANP